MNKAKLKSYAPSARRDFIQAVTDRAHFFGLSEKHILPVEVSGDVAIIDGRPFPKAVAEQRRKLDARVRRDGFGQVMEAVAYTWFNRFLALRFMELHGYSCGHPTFHTELDCEIYGSEQPWTSMDSDLSKFPTQSQDGILY